MKPKNLIHILIGIICIGLTPGARAVVPPPDGGYANFNTAEGQNALFSLTTGSANTAVGWFSLFSDTTGSFNTSVGAGALLLNTADENTAIGAAALLSNTGGAGNTAVGTQVLFSNTTGAANSGFGLDALTRNTTGLENTANGTFALLNNTEGSNNTATGRSALGGNVTGNNNTALGSLAGQSITGSGNVCIGAAVNGVGGANDSTWIRNVNTLTQNFSAGVNDYVTVQLSTGRLGHTAVVSSQRYKEEIKPLAAASQALYALKPVSFRLKKEFDPAQALGFGLIAEEVEKVDAALVYRNAKGQVESVRYEMVNAMLLNEFLKEHRKMEAQQGKIEEQDVTISQLKSTLAQQQKKFESKFAQQEQQIAALMADLQRLAADIELNKAESQALAEK